tara:strand:+ start:117 stop:560 length:444 start_codon:yes stop_codon:yes gene_type:complete
MENVSSKKINYLIRNCIVSLEQRNIKKVLSFLTEDVVWITPRYSYKGIREIKKYLTWLFKNLQDLVFIDEGIGVLVQGEKAVYQHILKAAIDGSQIQIPSIFIFRCKNNKCSHLWIMNDWLESMYRANIEESEDVIHMGWNRDYSNL